MRAALDMQAARDTHATHVGSHACLEQDLQGDAARRVQLSASQRSEREVLEQEGQCSLRAPLPHFEHYAHGDASPTSACMMRCIDDATRALQHESRLLAWRVHRMH